MPKLPRLSVRLHGGMTPRQCAEQAAAAEAAGIDAVWFAENPFARGIVPAAAACALATRTQSIGAGVFNPYGRHPTLIAMEIGALDELSGGRVRLGIGTGIAGAVERMGFGTGRSLTALREAIVIVRALLRGETVTLAGTAFNVSNVKLDYRARADIPIFMAARGANAVKACGELADGMIVSNMCAAGFVAEAVQSLNASAAAAARPPPGVVQYMPCVPRPDREAARSAAKRAIGDMLPAYWSLAQRLPDARRALLTGSGIAETEIASTVTRLKAGEAAEAALDDRFVDAFAIAGDADDCRAQAARFAEAGVTELALTFSGPTVPGDMAYIGKAFAG
ncbi:MAG: LLM class flavin-dependent oxidoreductase [Alphaproteobacteria bacterium]|nr:LLM class flavin-dependent oxidoreductase [Alphaproteobacteria bacterium]